MSLDTGGSIGSAPQPAAPQASRGAAIPSRLRQDVETLWNYHNLNHELRRCDVGIGLGSHDLGVAIVATSLFHRGLFPVIVFTGANAPTTLARFPRGEAVHYREYAVANGVPDGSILVEPQATNTAENFTKSAALLDAHGIAFRSMLVMSRPYQQRRAFATAKKLYPELDIVCASNPLPLDEYVESIGDVKRVIDMLVGDTQRIEVYAERGFAIHQEIPESVRESFDRLVGAGFTSRLI